MSKNPNVLLVVMDSVRASRVSCYGYERKTTPNIDEFAKTARRYECAISEGCWTVPSHGSIFTGEYSTSHGAHAENRSFDPNIATLAERLSSAGYNTFGASRNGWVTSENGFDRGFDEFHDRDHAQIFAEDFNIRSAIRRHEGKPALLRYGAFVKDALTCGSPLRGLANLAYFKYRDSPYCDDGASINNRFARENVFDSESPWFFFANYMEAHEPYYAKNEHTAEFLPEEEPQRSEFDGSAKWDYHAGRSTPPFESLSKLYDAEIRLLDDRIGSLLDSLRKRDELTDTLVIIAGDHGQHFGEQKLMGHVASPYSEAIHVPLLVSMPGQTSSKTISDPTTLRSIYHIVLSTVLDEEITEPEQVLSHCYGTHEMVFDEYPELDQQQWSERLVTKITETEGKYQAEVQGDHGRRQTYTFDTEQGTSVISSEGEDEDLSEELELMKNEDRITDQQEISDQLRDLGYL